MDVHCFLTAYKTSTVPTVTTNPMRLHRRASPKARKVPCSFPPSSTRLHGGGLVASEDRLLKDSTGVVFEAKPSEDGAKGGGDKKRLLLSSSPRGNAILSISSLRRTSTSASTLPLAAVGVVCSPVSAMVHVLVKRHTHSPSCAEASICVAPAPFPPTSAAARCL